MTSVQQMVRRAKRAYRACAHVEEEWLARELGDEPGGDLDSIQDALGDMMYPEQFATPWEKQLYEAVAELLADLDLKSFPRPHIVKLYDDFTAEQERRLTARRQMEAWSQEERDENSSM
jgi:hypothetical protein